MSNITIAGDDWSLISSGGTKQIVNQGATQVRLMQSATKPEANNVGVLVSNFSQPYAAVTVTGEDPVWAIAIVEV